MATIQNDINNLKVSKDQAKQEEKKEAKIQEFQSRLNQIRNSAFFLDEMSRLHQEDIK